MPGTGQTTDHIYIYYITISQYLLLKDKLRHIKSFKFISAKINLTWAAPSLADRKELQGAA